MHLSLLTTFAPPIFLVCPPNIFDKSTPVDEVTVTEAKPSRNFTRKSRTERLLSLSHEFLKTRAEKTKFPRRVGVLPRTIVQRVNSRNCRQRYRRTCSGCTELNGWLQAN